MTKRAFDKIAGGLREAIEYAKADKHARLAGEGLRRGDGPFPQASARPWRQEMVGAPASGGFHLYLVDAAGKKIAALWGKADEKADNGLLILDAVAAYDPDREQRIRELAETLREAGATLRATALRHNPSLSHEEISRNPLMRRIDAALAPFNTIEKTSP